MANFVTDVVADTIETKEALRAIPSGFASKYFPRALEFNKLVQWAQDIRSAIRLLPDFVTGQAVTWASPPSPIILAHRGTGNVGAPENTLAAFDYAASLGLPLELDVQATADGVLVVAHDSEWTRVTNGAVTTSVKNLNADATLRLDVSQGYRPDLFSPQRPVLFEDVLRRYGGKHLLAPEVKDELVTTAEAMARLVVRYGLQDSVLVTAFSTPPLSAARAIDSRIRTVLGGVTPPSAAGTAAGGHWGVFVSQDEITAPYVAEAHSLGLKVLAWTPNKVKNIEVVMALGVDGYTTDDITLPAITHGFTARGTRTVAAPPNSGLVGGGYRPYASGGATWATTVTGGVVTFSGMASVADGNYSHLFVPGIRLSAALATTQSFTVNLKYVQGPTSAVTTRYAGLKFCWDRDNDTDVTGGVTPSNGYTFVIRQNGGWELGKAVVGVFTSIATGTWAAIAAGTTVPLKVDLTATGITVTRTDTAQTMTATDATHARTGFVAAFGSGVVPGLGATTLTY